MSLQGNYLRRLAPIDWGVIMLSGFALLPIWTLDVFTTQDGPSHVYNAHALLGVLTGSEPYVSRYDVTLLPSPNWMGGALLALLGVALPLRVAERLVLSLSLVVFTLGVRRLTRGPDGATRGVALLAPAFACNATLYLGFHSYGLGLALVPWAWSLATNDHPRAWRWLVVVGILAWLCHLLAAALGALGVACVVLDRVARARDLSRLRAPALALAPTGALILGWLLSDSRPSLVEATRLPLETLVEGLIGLRALTAWVGPIEHVAQVLAVLLGLATARALWRDREPGQRAWLGLATVSVGLLLVVPEHGSGFAYLSDRLGLIPWLALLPVVGALRWRGAAPLAGLACAVLLTASGFQAVRLQPELAAQLALGGHVEPGATLAALDFSQGEPPARFRPFLHLAGYVAADRGGVLVTSHEAQTDHFHLRLARGATMPQATRLLGNPESFDPARWHAAVRYVLAYAPSTADRARLETQYDVVAHAGRSVLFEARSARLRRP